MKRKALGKGLGSSSRKSRGRRPGVAPVPRSGVDDAQQIPTRETFDEADLQSLTESIRRDGILQPVVARPAREAVRDHRGGEKMAGRSERRPQRIPVMVQEIADDRALELALVENLQRRDLDPLEEAKAFRLLSERFDLTQDQIAERVGKSRSPSRTPFGS